MKNHNKWQPYHSWDVSCTGLLPNDWEMQINEAIISYSFKTILTGNGSTSREKNINQKISVHVVDGTSIKASLPWLMKLYAGPFIEFASHCFGKNLFISNDQKSSININHIEGVGSRYEWHVDSNPVTGLLFSTTCDSKIGGALVFRNIIKKSNLIVRPKKGLFICFDARQIPHRVAPLKGDFSRTSIPMNFYESELEQARPSDLDTQIYTPSNTRGADIP